MPGNSTNNATQRRAARAYANRPYLRVLFECCQVYQRLYVDRSGAAYSGRCPRCLRTIRFRIGPNGTAARDFSVY